MAPAPPVAPRSSWAVRIVFAFLVGGLGLALVGAGSLVGFALLRLSDAPPPPAPVAQVEAAAPVELTPPDVWDRHGPIDVLLIGADKGLDAGCHESTYQLTDTLILIRFDPATGKAGVMSIPRDLYVPMPGRGARKITTAFALGQRDGDGPGYLRQTIQNNLELPVHRYVKIDIHGFQRIVDELGGIDVDVPPSRYNPDVGLYDPDYPDDTCGTVVVDFKPGLQHMDGKQALQYARSRKTTSDFDRSRRQIDVLMAMRDKALSLGILRRPGVIPAVLDTVQTDFTTREIIALMGPAMDVGDARIQRYPIDLDIVYDDWVEVDGVSQAVLRLHPDAYRARRQAFLDLADVTPPATATPPGGPAASGSDAASVGDPAAGAGDASGAEAPSASDAPGSTP